MHSKHQQPLPRLTRVHMGCCVCVCAVCVCVVRTLQELGSRKLLLYLSSLVCICLLRFMSLFCKQHIYTHIHIHTHAHTHTRTHAHILGKGQKATDHRFRDVTALLPTLCSPNVYLSMLVGVRGGRPSLLWKPECGDRLCGCG